ncbi:MAG TPA: hypothetical protein ACFYED_00060 [Candidatus Tripitaka californicus]|uniref:hypothetical protein n=1 Tax=Candidatus Tripitaka californicus TaxID=3367616 RepID=UPI00402544C1
MKLNEWVEGMQPVYITAPDTRRRIRVGWISEAQRLFRWCIEDRGERLRKWSAYAKDATVYEKIIKPYCDRMEVWDAPDCAIYGIAVARFDELKQLLKTKAGAQWMCERKEWELVREVMDWNM